MASQSTMSKYCIHTKYHQHSAYTIKQERRLHLLRQALYCFLEREHAIMMLLRYSSTHSTAQHFSVTPETPMTHLAVPEPCGFLRPPRLPGEWPHNFKHSPGHSQKEIALLGVSCKRGRNEVKAAHTHTQCVLVTP